MNLPDTSTLPPRRAKPQRIFALLAVLAGHGLLGWMASRAVLNTPTKPPDSAQFITLRLLPERTQPTPTAAPAAQPPAARAVLQRPQRERDSRTPSASPEPTTPSPAPPSPSSAVAEAALPSEVPASAPRYGSLLQSAGTRHALGQAGKAPLLAERADTATQTPQRPDASTRLGQNIQKAGHGDCLKGEFAGAGAGLLSLPLLVYAQATGQCAR
ncbi:hypothetical protein ACG0Z6_03295 [Roseateles sp. BYS180W]|uniref:Uncharacterized protein n=1 Tax=Roseateles rivi TaxID=3299028 RepID=A0ABW7FSF3_9BURK